MRKLILLLIISFAVCIAGFGMLSANQTAFANGGGDIDEICREYTNTSSPNGVNIYDYINDFNSKAQNEYTFFNQISQGTNFQNNCVYQRNGNCETISGEITGDDNITQMIPKALFAAVNEKLFLGKEYGFYINTRQKSGYLLSTVILIDIIKTDSGDDDYLIDIKVQPLIQLDYYYIYSTPKNVELKKYESEAFMGLSLCTLTLSGNISEAVVPAIRSGVNHNGVDGSDIYFHRYKQSADYSVSDISFASSIYNQRSLNYGDTNYDIDNDYGYFFIGNNYYYSATLNSAGNIEAGKKEITLSLVSAALGSIPIYGELFSISGTYLDVVQGISTATTAQSYNATNENYYYSELNSYNTRAAQKAEYGNLIRFSKMIINSDSDNIILFNNGDYARGIFNISHTDNPDGTKEYSKVNIEIALKIIDKTGYTTITKCFSSEELNYDINTPQTKTAAAFDSNSFYTIPGATQNFTIMPQYSSNYSFDFDNDNIDFYINDVQQTQQNGIYSKVMNANQTYNLSIKNNSTQKQYGSFFVDCADLYNSSNTLPINQEYIVKLDSASRQHIILTTQNTSVVFVKSFQFDFSIEDQNINLHEYEMFLTENRFYIVLKNQSSASQNMNVITKPLNQMQTNGTITLGSNIIKNKYIFQASAQQIYSFTFTFTSANSNFSIRILNSNYEYKTYSVLTESTKKTYNLQLQANETIYFIISKLNNYTNNLEVQYNITTKQPYQWIVGGQTTSTNNCSIKRGNNASISLKLNNNHILQLKEEYLSTIYNLSVASGVLYVNSMRQLGKINATFILNWYDFINENSAILDPEVVNFEINIIAENNINTALSTYNDNNSFGLIIDTNKIKGVTVRITNNNSDVTKTYYNNTNNLSTAMTYNNSDADVFITVMSVTYYLKTEASGNNTTSTEVQNGLFGVNYSYILSNHLFESGDGSATYPFLIRYERHFNNMQYTMGNPSYRYKQMKNITFANQPATRNLDFRGYYDGNLKIIGLPQFNPTSGNIGGLFRDNFGDIGEWFGIGITINGSSSVGSIGGVVNRNFGSIHNFLATIYINYTATNNSVYIGCIAADNQGTIMSCGTYGAIVSTCGHIGGITGLNRNALIQSCFSYTDITMTGNYNSCMGGISGINYNNGVIYDCTVYSTAILHFSAPSSNSRSLAPYIGRIVGINYGGTISSCTGNASINTGNLHTETWETGALWWKETHTWNQRQNVGGDIGATL